MKKAIISSLIISLIPGLCAAEHPRVAQLIAEKQQKMKKLEDCKGTTKALKIAGISTLGLTAVGVAGNIAEAVVLSNAKDDVKKAKSELKKQEERQEELQSQKEEQEAKAAEAEAKAKYGSKCINLTKDGQTTASFVDSICRITSSTELKIKENAQSEISKIVGGVCENVRETSTSNTFDAKCDGMSVRVQFGGTSITQSEQNKLDAKKKLIEVCNSDWSGKYNEAEDVCIIDKTYEEPVVANNILSTVQGYVNGASCVATTSYSNNTYETECSGMRVRVIFKEIKTADKSACESFGGRQPSGQLCQIQFDKPLVVMDNETVMNAVVKSVEQYIKEKKDQNVQCFAGNKVNDYKESGKTSFTVGCGDNTNMDILVTFRGVKCSGDKKWDSAQMECAKPTEAKQEVKQDAKKDVDETTFKLAGFNKNIVQVRRLIKWHSDNIAKLGVDPTSCKIDDIVSGKYGEDTVECDNKAFKFNSLNRYDSNAEKDLRKYFCSVLAGPAETECPGYKTAVNNCVKYILDGLGKCEIKTDEEFLKKEPVAAQNKGAVIQNQSFSETFNQQMTKQQAQEKILAYIKSHDSNFAEWNFFNDCSQPVGASVTCTDTQGNSYKFAFTNLVDKLPENQPVEQPVQQKEEQQAEKTHENPVKRQEQTKTIDRSFEVYESEYKDYVDEAMKAETNERYTCLPPDGNQVICDTNTTNSRYIIRFAKIKSGNAEEEQAKELEAAQKKAEAEKKAVMDGLRDLAKREFDARDQTPNDALKSVADWGKTHNVGLKNCEANISRGMVECDDDFEFKFASIIDVIARKREDAKNALLNEGFRGSPSAARDQAYDWGKANDVELKNCVPQSRTNKVKCSDNFEFNVSEITWVKYYEIREHDEMAVQTYNNAIALIQNQFPNETYNDSFKCNPPRGSKIYCFTDDDGYSIEHVFDFGYDVPKK